MSSRYLVVASIVALVAGCGSVADETGTSVEVMADTEDSFEAALLDTGTGETLAHLVWSEQVQEASITLYPTTGEVVTVPARVADALEPGTRRDVLLSGLRQAWVAVESADTYVEDDREVATAPVSSSQALRQPVGWFDGVWPSSVSLTGSNVNRRAQGWAYDPDRSSSSIWVHFYGTPAYAGSRTYLGGLYANQARPDVNRAEGITGRHGWSIAAIPEAWDADLVNDATGSCKLATIYSGQRYLLLCSVKLEAIGIDITGDAPRHLSGGVRYVSGAMSF